MLPDLSGDNTSSYRILTTHALTLKVLVSLFISTVPEVIPTREDMEVVVKVTRELKGYTTCLEGIR